MFLQSKHMPSKMWDEITYPFPNINGFNIEVWEWINNFIPQFIRDGISNPLNLIHISSRAPGSKQLPDSILSGVYDAIWHHKDIFNPSPNPNQWNHRIYRKISNIRRTKSQNLNASRLIL